MPVLLIRNERTGAAWFVWPEPEVPPAGAVQETGSYLFELQDAPHADAAELFIDDQPLEGLRAQAGTARWRWSPGFHAGTVDAELRLSGQLPRRFEIETDPDIRKLTRTDFDLMVREILEDTFALFAVSSFRRSVARGTGKRPPPIARLEFLRSRIDALEQIVAAIARRPRHMLRAEETTLPYYGAAPTRPAPISSSHSALGVFGQSRGRRHGSRRRSEASCRRICACSGGAARSICRSTGKWVRVCASGHRGSRQSAICSPRTT